MKCMSCSAPISPSFKAAIMKNVCPACGEQMMNDNTQELLTELKRALEEMPNDPEGIAGWILSHYELTKVGTGEPVQQFYGHPPRGTHVTLAENENIDYDHREDQLRNRPLVAPNKLQQFYQQAGIKKKTKADYAAIASQIQSEGSDYGDVLENTAPITSEKSLPISPQIQQQIQQMQSFNRQAQTPEREEEYVEEATDPEYTQRVLTAMQGVEGSDQASLGSDSVLSPEERAAIHGLMADRQSGLEHSDNLPPALHMSRMDRLKKQQDLQGLGSVGKITRRS